MWRRRTGHTGGNPPPRGVHCLDERGRRAQLTVAIDGERVLLGQPGGAPLTLTPLQVGRLRAALRAALLDTDLDPGGTL